MEYMFFISTTDNGNHQHVIEALKLKEALSLFAEYVLRKHPDIDYLGTLYYIYKDGKRIARKLKQSSKSYFWTFLAMQKEMEDYLEKNKVL